jgi:circadian clock protein KaiB
VETIVANYILKLYVTGKTPRAELAIANLRRICEEELRGEYEMQVIDVLEHPQLAEDEKILATPTLIKRLPPPLRPPHRHPRLRLIAEAAGCPGRTTLVSRAPPAAARRSSPPSSSPRGSRYGERACSSPSRRPPADIRRNMLAASAGPWPRGRRRGRWAFVDGSPEPDVDIVEVGSYDLGALLAGSSTRSGAPARSACGPRLAGRDLHPSSTTSPPCAASCSASPAR